jgi:hypothetical protein
VTHAVHAVQHAVPCASLIAYRTLRRGSATASPPPEAADSTR